MMHRQAKTLKGIAAGALAGLVGGLVMNQFQNLWSKLTEDESDSEHAHPPRQSHELASPPRWAAARPGRPGLCHHVPLCQCPAGLRPCRGAEDSTNPAVCPASRAAGASTLLLSAD